MPYRCEPCDFTYDLDRAGGVAGECRRLAREVAAGLASGEGVRARPAPGVWSPLEYGCHVRDVLLVQRERVLWALRVDDPAPEPMGRDERVEADGYAGQDPVDVARQVVDAADLFANVLDRLAPAAWERGIVYGYPPPPTRRTLRWVAVHTEHELVHHLADMHRR